MKPDPHTQRHGFSLIELLLAVTFGSLIMVLAVNLIQRAMAHQTEIQARAEQTGTLERFAERFRSDIHRATRVEPIPSGLLLHSESDDRISYSVSDLQLVCRRTVGSEQQIEVVKLLDDQTAVFDYQPSARTCELKLLAAATDQAPSVQRHVTAAVGLMRPGPTTPPTPAGAMP